MAKYLVFASIGFELVGLIIGSYYLSDLLDKSLKTNGLIFIILSFGSIITWLIRVIWLLKKMQKSEEDENLKK